jgi:cellulose synthase (UDP-forming)
LNLELMPWGYVLMPLAFAIGGLCLAANTLPMARRWARLALFAAVWLLVLRYLDWRLSDTVLASHSVGFELAWTWLCFAVESLALFDAFVLYVTFLRTSDRRAEATDHERRLRAMPADRLPSVDVFIATYNEPLEIIEKTIIGALSLDYPNFKVWVLDDGRRKWLRDFCSRKGAGYITRPDNNGAKAGNINHALTRTSADFVAVFDADFIPQSDFLMRTMGFFDDPRIGIVQVPHAFYNSDPLQANLALRKTLPDDQRFFFETIMPSRDGWDAAFCCGSNSVTRRSAMRKAGDALPTESITEDMLLSLKLLRHGYITRYLCEHLAFGLAPESIQAFFIQRQRWARGAMQILYLPEGPLGKGLQLIHRLLFLPTHWLSQSLMMVMSLVTPLIFMLFGVAPLSNVTVESALYYLVPSVVALVGGIVIFGDKRYFPLAAQVLGTFQSFKLLPIVLQTMLRPRGHLFKVTPKGSGAQGSHYERGIFWLATSLMLLTLLGMVVNVSPDIRIVDQAALIPLVAFWGTVNIVVLFLVCMMCLQAPIRRGEERFDVNEAALVIDQDGMPSTVTIRDLSLSGAGLLLDEDRLRRFARGDVLGVMIAGVGTVGATVARIGGNFIGMQFDLPESIERDLLIRKIFTRGLNAHTAVAAVGSVTLGMLRRIWSARMEVRVPQQGAEVMTVAPSSLPEEKLPAETSVLQPKPADRTLADLAAGRQLAA